MEGSLSISFSVIAGKIQDHQKNPEDVGVEDVLLGAVVTFGQHHPPNMEHGVIRFALVVEAVEHPGNV